MENIKAERTTQERLRAAQTQNPALAALNQQAADAAAAAAAAANPPLMRPRTRSRRKAAAPGLAVALPVQQLMPPIGVCRAFSSSGTCKFGDRCSYKHVDANGREIHEPKAAARLNAQAKRGARTPSSRNDSRRPSKKTLEARKLMPCRFFATAAGCRKG